MCLRPKILGCCAPWTKRPLDIVSLTDVSRPWTASSMELALSAAILASVGCRRLMNHWGVWLASPTPLTRFIGLAPLRQMHARPTHAVELHRWAALKRAAVGSLVSLCSIKSKGWDGSVRGKIVKGHFVQGLQHPRIFGRGHIGRGWTNIAPFYGEADRQLMLIYQLTTSAFQMRTSWSGQGALADLRPMIPGCLIQKSVADLYW